MILCRLCGEEKSPLDFSIELDDKTSLNWTYQELIEHHSRISLKTNKLLSKSICEECKAHIEAFAEFSLRLEAVQNSLEELSDDSEQIRTEDCLVQVEENCEDSRSLVSV